MTLTKIYMKNKTIFLLSFFSCLCLACTNKSVKPKGISNAGTNDVESFSEFIEKFHSDSVFAMSRINEETQGTDTDEYTRDSVSSDSVVYLDNTERIWSKEEMGKYLNYFNQLRRDEKKYSTSFVKKDSCIEEILCIPGSGFSMNIYFQLSENKWFVKQCDYINL